MEEVREREGSPGEGLQEDAVPEGEVAIQQEELAPEEEAALQREETTPDGEESPEEEINIQELLEKMARVEAQAQEYYEQLKRLAAEFENFRRRTRQEKEDLVKLANERLIYQLLPVLDNFERALSAEGKDLEGFRSGVEMIFRQFKGILEREGLQEMNCLGQEFDPNYHEAILTVEGEGPPNTIVEELQKGYLLGGKVLRPAMVKVSS